MLRSRTRSISARSWRGDGSRPGTGSIDAAVHEAVVREEVRPGVVRRDDRATAHGASVAAISASSAASERPAAGRARAVALRAGRVEPDERLGERRERRGRPARREPPVRVAPDLAVVRRAPAPRGVRADADARARVVDDRARGAGRDEPGRPRVVSGADRDDEAGLREALCTSRGPGSKTCGETPGGTTVTTSQPPPATCAVEARERRDRRGRDGAHLPRRRGRAAPNETRIAPAIMQRSCIWNIIPRLTAPPRRETMRA